MLVCIYYYVVDTTLFLFSGDAVLFIMNMFCIWWEVQASPEGYHHLCVHNVSFVNFLLCIIIVWQVNDAAVCTCKRCVCWNMFVDQCSSFRSTLLEWDVCICYHSALTPCNHDSWVVVPEELGASWHHVLVPPLHDNSWSVSWTGYHS